MDNTNIFFSSIEVLINWGTYQSQEVTRGLYIEPLSYLLESTFIFINIIVYIFYIYITSAENIPEV